jgi:signal transduction histidine kinase/DNA-binding response OmpR family regulator
MINGTQKINILLVDDSPSNLLSLETILSAPDRNLVRASSGEEALRYLLNEEAALILLDVRMPKIDGLETAALIRGRERTRNVPIIFLTAYDSVDGSYISEGYSLGAVDFIIKPIDPEALKSKVAVFVELFRKTEQVRQQAELLREKNIAMENANLHRLSRLINLGQQLVAERDPERLLQTLCQEARDIVGARYATVGLLEEDGETLRHFCASGFDREAAIRAGLPQANHRFLDGSFKSDRSLRLMSTNGALKSIGFSSICSPITSFLGAPILWEDRTRGWLYLADKIAAPEFSEADERFAVTLTQAIVFYKNARLYAELQRHTADLEQEIATRIQTEKERAELLVREQAARAEAETANRLKDEFLATVSHELRAPLNAILGWASLLQSGKLDEATNARAIETIERNARAQNKLIEDLLDVSRIITGKLQLDVKPVDLASIIEMAAESVRPAAEAKGVRLQTELGLAASPVQVDANRLQQVVWNLASNAVKFTPTGGSVNIKLRCFDNQAEISVSDTGIGIPPKFLPYVFDRFRQADSSETRTHGGLGLGLAIVRHLVEMHGGTVRAESEGEGRGATFTITLQAMAPGVAPDETPLLPTPDQRIVLSDLAPKLSGLRVLVVDDQAEVRDLLFAILHLGEAEVQMAEGVAEALEILTKWQPDILISDISMPGGDGYDLIRRVRQQEQTSGRRLPALALTARASAEDRIRALAAGFQMHLPKPVEPDELLVSIASLTGRLRRPSAAKQ